MSRARRWIRSFGLVLACGTAGTVFAALGIGAAPGPGERDLLAAAGRGDATALRRLTDRGADPDTRDADGRPALVLAAHSRHFEAVRALLQAGADPDRADPSGWSALHESATLGLADVVGLLLASDAAVDLPSRARGTALDVAERTGQSEIATLLRSAGARGSGKSLGDTVCVRRWGGDGYCGTVTGADPTRHHLHVTSVVGCSRGCAADAACSEGRSVGGGTGLTIGDEIWVPSSCLTHTGLGPR